MSSSSRTSRYGSIDHLTAYGSALPSKAIFEQAELILYGTPTLERSSKPQSFGLGLELTQRQQRRLADLSGRMGQHFERPLEYPGALIPPKPPAKTLFLADAIPPLAIVAASVLLFLVML